VYSTHLDFGGRGIPFPSLFVPSLLPSVPLINSPPFLFPSPLEVGPIVASVSRSGGAHTLPQRVEAEPGCHHILVHFRHKFAQY